MKLPLPKSWRPHLDAEDLTALDGAPRQLDQAQRQSLEGLRRGDPVPASLLSALMAAPAEPMVAVDDCGRVLNPLLTEGQRHGGTRNGAGVVG